MNIIATVVAASTSLFLVAAADAAPKTVAPAAAEAVSKTVTPSRNPATRYCYNTEATGTRIIQRVCHTRADWKELGVIVPDRL